MKYIILTVTLITAFITYGQLKTQPTQEKAMTAASAHPQQTARYDPNNN